MRLKNTQTYFSLWIFYCLVCSSCTDHQPFNYDCGPEIELDIEIKDFSICLLDYGHIKITPLTGESPYSYFWSNGWNPPIFSSRFPTSVWYKEYTSSDRYKLGEGSYFVTVTDAEGGYTTKEIKVQSDKKINLRIDDKKDTTKKKYCDGSITITPQGKEAKKYSVDYTIVGPDNYGGSSSQIGSLELKNLCKGDYVLVARLAYCHGELDFTIE